MYLEQFADARLDAARALHYAERSPAQEQLLEWDEEEYVARVTEELLGNTTVMASMLADYWEDHPDRIGRLLATAASENPILAPAAVAEIKRMCRNLAEREACRRYQAGER